VESLAVNKEGPPNGGKLKAIKPAAHVIAIADQGLIVLEDDGKETADER
jgi:hypothetical protein